MYHKYLDKRYTPEQVKKMQSVERGSKTVNDFVDPQELQYLQKIIRSKKYAEIGKTSKYSAGSYNDLEGRIIKHMFHKKILDAIGDYDLDFYTWQEAINPWKIHADIRWYSDRLPYKVLLVPLDVIGEGDYWADTYTIAFKQWNFLEGNKNTNAGQFGNNDQSNWIRVYDQPGIHNLCNGFKITKDQHEKYFSHMPYEFLEGLEIDNLYKWTPGSCVIWDQTQLHCADNFHKKGIKTKLSLLFFTNQKQ